MTPPRTINVQAAYGLQLIGSQELVDWATEAIVFGSDSRSLRLLAGLQSPFDQEEVKRLFKTALKELQIEELPTERRVSAYTTSILKALLNKEFSRKEALRHLSDLHDQLHYDRQLQDFSNLYNAKKDLDLEYLQWYWKDANSSNINAIIDDYVVNWLREHAVEKNS